MKTRAHHEQAVKAQRLFRAPLQRVYTAWTNPELLRQWWGGPNIVTHELTIDPRVQGEVLWIFNDEAGRLCAVHGEVREHVPREKIAFTWTAGHAGEQDHARRHPDYVAIDFREARGVEVRIVHTGLADKAAREHHAALWNGMLDRLQGVLEG